MPTKVLLPRCVHRPRQAYVPPFLDLRYITSITNDGLEVSCQTFQRHFSRRYVPFRPPGLPPLPAGTLVGAASAAPAGAGAAAAAAAAAAQAEEEAASPAVDAAGLLDAAAEGTDLQLDERVLADMERSLGRTLGPVDPGLKMQVRYGRTAAPLFASHLLVCVPGPGNRSPHRLALATQMPSWSRHAGAAGGARRGAVRAEGAGVDATGAGVRVCAGRSGGGLLPGHPAHRLGLAHPRCVAGGGEGGMWVTRGWAWRSQALRRT